jgi:hypothetical protein
MKGPAAPRRAPIRRITLAALTAVVLAGAGVVAYSRSGEPTQHAVAGTTPDAAMTVPVPADRGGDIAISPNWTVHIPRGSAGTQLAQLSVTPIPGLLGPVDSTSLGAARLTMSSGQPTAPWTITWRLDRPLEADRVLYLVDDNGDGSDYGAPPDGTQQAVTGARVHPAEMSADRLTGSVTVAHLGFQQWLTDVAGTLQNALGRSFVHRGEQPRCAGTKPAWLSNVTFPHDQNGPMRACVGADPVHPELSVVKVSNNSGGALIVKASAKPAWAWQSVLGDKPPEWAPDLLAQVAEKLAVPGSRLDRTWVLPPGQQVHLGLSEAALRAAGGGPVITSLFTPSSVAFGLVSGLSSEQAGDKSTLWDYGAFLACATSLDTKNAALAFTSLAKCVVEHPERTVNMFQGSLSPAVGNAQAANLVKAAGVAKKTLSRYLAIPEETYNLGDIVATTTLPPSAFTISLVLTAPLAAPTKVVNVAAVTRAGRPTDGYHIETDVGSVSGCDSSSAALNAGIASCSPSAASADVCWVGADRVSLLCGGDPWKKTLYQATSDTPIGTLSAAANPTPWALELADGAKCRVRNGGAWGGRTDNYVGAYSCDPDRSDEYVLVQLDQGEAVHKSGPVWTVLVGQLGNADEVFPAPKEVRVVTAYFATAP